MHGYQVIPKLFNHQFLMIVSKLCYMISQNLNYLQNCYFRFSVRELNNSLVSDTNDGGLKDARDEDDKIIISDYTFRSLFPPQLKQMSARYKVRCGREYCISAKIIHSLLISWHDRYLKN